MWGWILRALAWASTASIGWVAGDVYNEYQTTGQLTAASVGQSVKPKIPWILTLAVGFLIVIALLKVFNLTKFLKK